VSARERAKGARGELEVAHILRAARLAQRETHKRRARPNRTRRHSRRARSACTSRSAAAKRSRSGRGSPKPKREARAGDAPVVAFRRSRSRWYAAVPLEACSTCSPTAMRRD
jgi:hypothetical protein